MGRLLTTRRSQWIRGVAAAAAVLATGALAGAALGAAAWPLYAGLALAAGALFAGVDRLLRRRRPEPPEATARGKLRVVQGSPSVPYDLAKDDRTDGQRYLM